MFLYFWQIDENKYKKKLNRFCDLNASCRWLTKIGQKLNNMVGWKTVANLFLESAMDTDEKHVSALCKILLTFILITQESIFTTTLKFYDYEKTNFSQLL